MTIEQKLADFRRGADFRPHYITEQEAASLGISTPKPLAKSTILERNSRLQSPVNPGTDLAFFGAYSYMNNDGYMRDQVFVGRYCSIGRRVTLGAGMHDMVGVSSSPALRGANGRNYTPEDISAAFDTTPKSRGTLTTIGNDVWIGDGVVVLPGLTIGSGAVIGANAVITKDVTPYEIVGCPQTTLRYRFKSEIIEQLLASRWWNYKLDAIKALPTSNILQFLDSVSELSEVETYENYRHL